MQIHTADTSEHHQAFELLFQHCLPNDQQRRAENALLLLRQGELQPEGLFVVSAGKTLLGAITCLPRPGAVALIWPPQVKGLSDPVSAEDQLVQHVLTYLRQQGVKVGQVLLEREEVSLAAPLERNGFRHITALWHFRHFLDLSSKVMSTTQRCTYQGYHEIRQELFHETLLRTYEDSLDCPEINGARTLEEIIVGHKAEGPYRPETWWLAQYDDTPIGVVLITDLSPSDGWEVSYVGVVPEARQQGFGREIMTRVLLEAKCAGAAEVSLSVDQRNEPAWKLYRALGFEPFDHREVYLTLSKNPFPGEQEV